MKFLFFSVLASTSAIEEARRLNPNLVGFAVQKFNRLIAEGLTKNGAYVKAVSSFYIPNINKWYRRKKESHNGVEYQYITSPSNSHLRHLWLIISSFFSVLFWGLSERGDKAIICDVLNISVCLGSITAARILGIKRLGIMTDMPGLYINRRKDDTATDKKNKERNTKVSMSYLDKFTHYVFLTEKMNEVINIHNKPYVVMEGLADITDEAKNVNKEEERIVFYAGGLHERYGLKLLVEGFLKADVPNTELWLYGDGPFVSELIEYERKDSRIRYFGLKPNNEIIKAERSATLLVNPRPTHEEFTQYSFPSKNIEFMVSGTPLLTTRLPGMPKEYYPFVYLFDEESVEGYSNKLKEILSLSSESLASKGEIARDWIIKNKSYINQTNKIINLLH